MYVTVEIYSLHFASGGKKRTVALIELHINTGLEQNCRYKEKQ